MLKEDEIRRDLLSELSQDSVVVKTLMGYTENKFVSEMGCRENYTIPMLDEAFVPVWESYASVAERYGALATLRSKIIQFQFPIMQNISETEAYKAATLRGQPPKENSYDLNFLLRDESSLTLHIHKGLAGAIPVLIAGNEEDFYLIVQALRFKNEPVALPKSMGAAMIRGLNNWDRLKVYENNWSLLHPFGDWKSHFFKNVLPDKGIYQDKLIVLSKKGYSGVSAKDLAIDEKKWAEISLEIRLQHEYAHYFTLRYFGHMANNMHDELVADYAGINKVLGKFSASWFLRFIGLHGYPNYQQGGRLENYIKKDEFSEEAFSVLCLILYKASFNIEKFDDFLGNCDNDLDRTMRLMCLCETDLLTLSGTEALSKLQSVYFLLQKTYNIVKNEG